MLTSEKENQQDLVNRMRNYKDPLLEDFDKETAKDSKLDEDEESSAEEESGDSDDESSGDDEIEFPRDNADDLLQFIQRDLVNLDNKEDDQKRKFALMRLYQIFALAKNKAPARVY